MRSGIARKSVDDLKTNCNECERLKVIERIWTKKKPTSACDSNKNSCRARRNVQRQRRLGSDECKMAPEVFFLLVVVS